MESLLLFCINLKIIKLLAYEFLTAQHGTIMVCNYFIGMQIRFVITSLLYTYFYAGSCKNEAAAKRPDLIIETEQQAQQSTRNGNAIERAQRAQTSDVIPDNIEKSKQYGLQAAANPNHPDEDLKAYLEPRDQIDTPPSFSLQDNLTIQAGTKQSIALAAMGKTEGYSIKSISIAKNGRYYTSKFGVGILTSTPIPPSGLPITLTADPALTAGHYELKIRIGKTGKGSRQTEQWAKSTIHIITDEVKNDKQEASCSTNQTIEPLSNETINNCLNQDETDGSEKIQTHQAHKDTTPTQLNFTLKDITIQVGTEQPITPPTGRKRKKTVKQQSDKKTSPSAKTINKAPQSL